MPRLVIIGGGIAGLSAAWAARREARSAGTGVEVVVLERAAVVGGKARTIVRDGWLVEGGPSGYLGGRPELERLIDECGLSRDVVAANAAAARRFILHTGQMRLVKPNPIALWRGGLLSGRGVLRLLREPFVPRRIDRGDETMWAFAARRLGTEAADRLIRPMALGIFAGDAQRLSLAAAFPRMAALERDHGSLVRGLIARRGRMSSGILSSFRDGMQSLPRVLAARGDFSVHRGTAVRTVRRSGSGWTLSLEAGGPLEADAVLLAGEPWASAALLREDDPEVAATLDAISCPAVTVVALGYGPGVTARIPVGFGVLIAREEGYRMLGNLWETHLYPGRGPEGHVLIRAMLGGAVDPESGRLSEPDALALVRQEVERLYGIREAPVFTEVVRTPHAIPQYEVGHRERVAAVERGTARHPGLHVTGFGLRGVAFADAATDGVRSGETAVRDLLSRAGQTA